jgi:hypothetical protein
MADRAHGQPRSHGLVEGEAAGYSRWPRPTLLQEQTMGKYVLGWFLGVPLIVLVAIYFIAH